MTKDWSTQTASIHHALLATILFTVLLAAPAMSVDLFRYRGADKDGGTLEYIFKGLACASLTRRTCRHPEAECGFGVAQKSDPGSVQTKESRLRTRTRNRLNQWYQTARFPRTFKGGHKTLPVTKKNEPEQLLKIPSTLGIFPIQETGFLSSPTPTPTPNDINQTV
jgi:hypothetical protein